MATASAGGASSGAAIGASTGTASASTRAAASTAARRSVIVVGSGIAGLTAALRAARTHDVTLVTKGALGDGNTRWAQGGIAAVTAAPDTVASHVADTLSAGAGLADHRAVRVLCAEGPDRIADLIAAGVEFDRHGDTFALALEAAHSHARVLRAGGDATGAAISAALVARVRESGIRILEHTFLVDLELADASAADGRTARVAGARVRHADARESVLAADTVILATGGAGQLFAHTTNPTLATGDGLAAAMRAGAAVADLEFYQFHPTALAGEVNFLISEAVRGEGAVLVDDGGRRFMLHVHPDAELAPRDVVARGIADAMAAQHGRPVGLDARALGAGFLAERFPTIDAELRRHGIDWAREIVPVTPAAHYWMGGIATDLDGRTTVPGLFAVGEVARTGVHGANRLASNSLLEGAVFGARAADAIGLPWRLATGSPAPASPAPLATGESHSTPASLAIPAGPATALASPPPATIPFSRAALQRLLWDSAGLLRTGDALADAAATLAHWASEPRDASTPADLEDGNLLQIARALVEAASARTASVGAHFRSDGVPALSGPKAGAPMPGRAHALASAPALPPAPSRTPAELEPAC